MTSVPHATILPRLSLWENVSIAVLITSLLEEVSVLVSCSQCSISCNGLNQEQYTSCSNPVQVVFMGECLNNCPDNFFIRGSQCVGKMFPQYQLVVPIVEMDPTMSSVCFNTVFWLVVLTKKQTNRFSSGVCKNKKVKRKKKKNKHKVPED